MTVKSYEEMDESHRLAYLMGRSDQRQDYSQLDGYPALYEVSPEMVPHLEGLGVGLRKVSNQRIAATVVNNLDLNLEAAEAAYQEWMDLDVVHIEYHRESMGGGPVEAILAAARKGNV